MKKTKGLMTVLLALCLMFNIGVNASAANLPPNTNENANTYSSDWVYWCQGASRYRGMRGYGCRMVAQSKLLVEAGIVQGGSFDPDVYFEWCKSNGYIDGRTMCELNCGQGPGAYASTVQKNLTYSEQVSLYGSKADRAAQIMSYLNNGYYVILGSAAHHAYVSRSASLHEGTPIIYDSWSGYSYNTATVQKYTNYKLVNFSYMWIFSTGEAKELPTPPNPVRVTLTTGTADTITETSAILRGSFTTTGKRATECGMYLGTDQNNLTKLGSDSVNTFGTSMFYSTAKYGRSLNPGTTYYYQAYVIVGGTEYRGNVESFRAKGNPPAPALGVSLSSNSLTLGYGTCNKLNASTTPAALPVTWKSTDESVVTVTDGVVTAVSSGTADVIAEVFGNGKIVSAKCRVTVEAPSGTEPVPVDPDIKLVQSAVTLDIGERTTLQAITTPAGQTIGWNSSNEAVAVVDQSGIVTALAAGTATITAYMEYNGDTYFALCGIVVKSTAPDVTLSVSSVTNIAQTTARVNASCAYGTGCRPSSVGLYLGTSLSSLSYWKSDDSITHNKNPFDIWYTLSDLSAGTTYYYQFYAKTDRGEVRSEVSSFTTESSAPTPVSNTRTAIVVNTNGQYLAINDRPAASPRYSNQIGRIPPSGTVTVYTDKTSGNWYYVEYNGVSGYVYGKYLSLR